MWEVSSERQCPRYTNNASVRSGTDRVRPCHPKTRRWTYIRYCQDGNDNNSISNSISIFTCVEASSEAPSPAKAQTYHHLKGRKFELRKEAGRNSETQTIQEPQWYVCRSYGCLILEVIRHGLEAKLTLVRLHNLQSQTVKMRRDEANMSAMSQERCFMWGIQEGFQMEAVRGDDLQQDCTAETKTKYGAQDGVWDCTDGLQIQSHQTKLRIMLQQQVPSLIPQRQLQVPKSKLKMSQCKSPSSMRRRRPLHPFPPQIMGSQTYSSITLLYSI
jgi:hypothetical protein